MSVPVPSVRHMLTPSNSRIFDAYSWPSLLGGHRVWSLLADAAPAVNRPRAQLKPEATLFADCNEPFGQVLVATLSQICHMS